MPTYQCPECEALLRRENAVEKGKKIKCPKCEMIFVAKALPEEDEVEEEVPKKKAEKRKPVPAKKTGKSVEAKQTGTDDDEEEGGSYSVVEEKTDGGGDSRKKDLYFGSLRDKFAKSKRGPAMAEVVFASNFLMAEGMILCILALIGFSASIWPFIFSDQPPARTKAINLIWAAVLNGVAFAQGGFICYAASCMHELRYYALVWAGVIMGAFPAIGGILVMILIGGVKGEWWGYPAGIMGIFIIAVVVGIQKLTNQLVKDGFIETVERASELKNEH